MTRIYADHNATSPLLPAVAERLSRTWETPFANPSSTHTLGRKTREAIDAARTQVAQLLGTQHIVFTGSATEANATALYGHAAAARKDGRERVVISAIEHPSVIENAKRLRELGYQVDIGLHDLAGAGVCALMWANNETGLLQPIAEVAAECAKHGVRLHVDAVQAAGKVGVLRVPAGVDSISASAHKLGGLTGVGALGICGRAPEPWMIGGGQERGMRGGTENVHGVFAFGWAAQEWLSHGETFRANMRSARDAYERALTCAHKVIGGERIPNTSDVIITGVRAEALLSALDLEGVAASHGAACATGSLEPSPVLLAMGFSDEEARSVLRVSFGPLSSAEEGGRVGELVSKLATKLAHKR